MPTLLLLLLTTVVFPTNAVHLRLRVRQIPGLIDTMTMAATHMVGDNLQGKDAAADLSNTVLSENFRSRFRVKLHCPVNPHNDWLRAQNAGVDILLSGDAEFSEACFQDAFHMYFNKLKQKQKNAWRSEEAQHAQKMTNMWKTFEDKVRELKTKGDKLAGGPHALLSDTAGKHAQLEILNRWWVGGVRAHRTCVAANCCVVVVRMVCWRLRCHDGVGVPVNFTLH